MCTQNLKLILSGFGFGVRSDMALNSCIPCEETCCTFSVCSSVWCFRWRYCFGLSFFCFSLLPASLHPIRNQMTGLLRFMVLNIHFAQCGVSCPSKAAKMMTYLSSRALQ